MGIVKKIQVELGKLEIDQKEHMVSEDQTAPHAVAQLR